MLLLRMRQRPIARYKRTVWSGSRPEAFRSPEYPLRAQLACQSPGTEGFTGIGSGTLAELMAALWNLKQPNRA